MFTAEQRNLLLFIVAKQVVPVLLQFVARVQVVEKKKLNSLSCIFRWRNGEEERAWYNAEDCCKYVD